ncbi:MAG: EAL domain-containing protein [Phycisphaerales bacterium]|nr:EAL domain-containing protein [Phycisphaerales bacterium]
MSADSRAGRPGAAGRVLVIEDDLAVIRVVERSLRAAGFETLAALEGKEGIALAQSRQPDLVLCDIGLPGLDGHGVLQCLRQDEATRDIPFIFLTGSIAHDDVRLGMRLGADDYLTKPFMPKDLVEAVQARLARRRQITEGMQSKLAAMMGRLDLPTAASGARGDVGLPDRRQLEADVAADWRQRRSEASPLIAGVVRALDVDRNDARLGHVALESLQQQVEERIAAAAAAHGVACRAARLVGFGRFGVVFPPGVQLAAATAAMQALLQTLRSAYWLQGGEVFVQFSAGVAAGAAPVRDDASLRENLTQVLLQAETASRPAPGEARQSVGVFRDGMRAGPVENLRLDADLHHAVERGQLHVVYQPQVELASDVVLGFEALVRWQHPEFGTVSPAHFIPLAEQNGTILRIGEWVLWESCRQVADWLRRGFPVGRVAVNVSAVQMQEADVPELVRAALAAHALDPCRLQLEITESAVLHDLARAKAMIRDVRELGVSVAIDDFGTGQSSLAYLQQLKFDELKIDRSFIQGVERHSDRIAIVELILNLAEKLGFTVTAEGIENEVTRDLLTSRRCQLGQGYHFARPMSVEAVAAVMSGRRPGMLLTAADLARAARGGEAATRSGGALPPRDASAG